MDTDETVDATVEERDSREGVRRIAFVVAAVLILVAFTGAYGFAASRPSDGVAGCEEAAAAAVGVTDCASGCCGTGEAAEPIEGAAVVDGDVQRISVDVSGGYFDPSEIVLTAGIPTEITFSEGQGCMAEVMFEQFGIREDLTSGGAVVTLPELDAGTYEFSCGMRMVFGRLVVR